MNARDLVVAFGEQLAQRVGRLDGAVDAAEALVVGVARGEGAAMPWRSSGA